MTSADAASRRRRREAPRKGDLREQAILDAAEEQLGTQTLDRMTVESIARGAGITRNALYFYFASKQDVLTALVRRTVEQVANDAASTAADTGTEPAERIVRAVHNTERHWIQHGVVMRAAVELGAVIPEIGAMWTETVERYITVTTEVMLSGGLSAEGPGSAEDVARALCWMTERNFYYASAGEGGEDALRHTSDVCIGIWLRMLP
ncbi:MULTISPECIES: TetR/AcrR family transcriptional regulator [Actinomadura]|uniref:DNA-binding transcriptional regulator, AcrR family n=1 Tax=Actinomadura madurae TaxID=1993 RepID=A0A1I5X002_9ACTN|nr:TetR/AcrR family transcriptional regulator [Actinomadura madurae]SFQ25258.1 DNA-binding transcriptional regulator, AcrR family [Actinomadura madurae]SPT60733.1 HTH-type transcriptional regulator EthR [Actinomadura madurae]